MTTAPSPSTPALPPPSAGAANAAVLRLFDAYFDRVYRFVRRSVDPATAEEVAQDVFIKLLSRTNIETKQVSVSYLIKIADNMLKRRHHRGQRTLELIHQLARNSDRATAAHPAPHPSDDSVLNAFDRLSHEEQEAVRLIVCEGLSYRDAAASLGVRVSTINNWKHRGIQRLKEHIRAEGAPPSAARPGPTPLQSPVPGGDRPGTSPRAKLAPRGHRSPSDESDHPSAGPRLTPVARDPGRD